MESTAGVVVAVYPSQRQEVWDLPDEKNARKHPSAAVNFASNRRPPNHGGDGPDHRANQGVQTGERLHGRIHRGVQHNRAHGQREWQPPGGPQQTRRGDRQRQAEQPRRNGTDRASRDGPSFGSFHLGVAMGFDHLVQHAGRRCRQRGSGHGQKKGFPEQRMVLTTGGDGSGGGGPNDQDAQTGL